MRKLGKMMMTASLLICAVPFTSTALAADSAPTSQQARARQDELRGDLAQLHNENLEAFNYYLAALRYDRHDAVLVNKMGIVELQLDEHRTARRDFRLALRYNPQFIPALNNMGAVYLLDKKYKPAIRYFKRALALNELSAPTHLNLAEAWVGMKKIDFAMTEYERALELDPDVLSDSQGGTMAQISTPAERAQISFLIAEAYMKRGNPDGALDYLGRAKALHYRDLHRVYTDPAFAALWKDPRLAEIIKR